MSIRDDILGADDLTRESITIPEWGQTVYVHTLDGGELFALQEAYAKAPENLRPATLAIGATRDAEGNAIFAFADAELLHKKSGRAVKALAELSSKLNLLTAEADKELEKNSDGAPS